MATRFIVRPDRISTTPRRLKELLGAQRTIPISNVTEANYAGDLLLAYPDASKVRWAPAGYDFVREFYLANKKDQRLLLKALDIKTIPVNERGHDSYVVRPLRHRAGQQYRLEPAHGVWHSQLQVATPCRYNPATEYASPLIAKDREYRVIFFKGKRVCVYLKRVPDNLNRSDAWTHANGCRFITLEIPHTSRLEQLAQQLHECTLTKTAHLIAYDIILDTSGDYWVCEANLCPGISIERTLLKIKSLS